jgi:glyoxylase-like metal-dependent hydrolase (beta-lactamase superfamily II)
MRMKHAIWLVLLSSGCAFSHHDVVRADLGKPTTLADAEKKLDEPGPLTVETITSARWAVTRAGLINLDSAAAKSAGLVDGDEPIVVDVHVIKHPTKGTFLVDSGVERATGSDRAAVRGVVASVMHVDKMKIEHDTASIVKENGPITGVLLTHLHLDHVMGLPDVPNDVAIYAGPGETSPSSWQNMLLEPNIDRALAGKGALREFDFGGGDVLDVFGDGSLFAIHVPGHTPGSTAYLARTTTGPVLFTGDASHTKWGWEHDVEPGTFSVDQAQSRASLAKLRRLVARHPNIDVRLGHQHLEQDSG